MSKFIRRRIWIDPTVQGAIVRRVVGYFLCCVMFVVLPTMIVWEIAHPNSVMLRNLGEIWNRLGLVVLAAVVLLPLAIYDVIKWSHRFSGPIYRLRMELERLADGEDVRPVKFRDTDYWPELAEAFSRVADRLKAAERKAEEPMASTVDRPQRADALLNESSVVATDEAL